MGIKFGSNNKADDKTKLAIAIEQHELEYGKMTPEQKFIFKEGWWSAMTSLTELHK